MVRLTIPAQLCFKDLAFTAVLAAVDAEAGAPGGETRDHVLSALGEAINNVVLHAYRGVVGGTIDLAVNASPGELEIRMEDRGRGFDPAAVPSFEALGELPESGMGLYIMRSFMDEVAYTRGSGGKPNVWLLRKRWGSHEAAQPLPAGGVLHDDLMPARRETSQSGWRIRSVAAPAESERAAGSLKRK